MPPKKTLPKKRRSPAAVTSDQAGPLQLVKPPADAEKARETIEEVGRRVSVAGGAALIVDYGNDEPMADRRAPAAVAVLFCVL